MFMQDSIEKSNEEWGNNQEISINVEATNEQGQKQPVN